MKLNVGDLVELLYDGTLFSGVITSVTPERVELAFTLNIFVEGDGKVTWPNGVDMAVDVGANALTKLHLRLPLEEVARAYAAAAPEPPPREPARTRHPTRKTRAKELLDAAAAEAPPPPAAPPPEQAPAPRPEQAKAAPRPEQAPAPPPEQAKAAPRPERPPATQFPAQPSPAAARREGPQGRPAPAAPGPPVGDLEALLAELGGAEETAFAEPGGALAAELAQELAGASADETGFAETGGALAAELAQELAGASGAPAEGEAGLARRERQGMWVEHESLVDGTDLASGAGFPASMLLVSVSGALLRVMSGLSLGDRLQLRFTLGRDSFDLAASVVHRETPEVYEVTYDQLPSEVRVRMLRAVLGLAKPELRTKESWTYQLRHKGGG